MTNSDSTFYTQHKTTQAALNLEYGFTIADLYSRDGLVKLDQAFLDYLSKSDDVLYKKLNCARAHPDTLPAKDESALLIEIAPWLEDFIANLFGIESEVKALAERHHELAPLYFCKRQFVQRRAKGKVSAAELEEINGLDLEQKLTTEFGTPFTELVFATKVTQWMDNEAEHEDRLKIALHYAAWALRTPEGQKHTQQGILFKSPAKLDL